MERSEVYQRIDEERAYQQAQGYNDTAANPTRWIDSIEYYTEKARSNTHEDEVMSNVRKIAALAVAALEQYGCPPRDGFEQPAPVTLESVPEGTYKTKHGDGLITYTAATNQLSVSQIKTRMTIYVGTLPDGWVLMRPAAQEDGNDG